MENSSKSSSGGSTDITKKKKCLDLQTIYNAKVSEEESSQQRKCRKETEGKIGDGQKKIITEFSLDRIDQGRKKRRKNSDEGDGVQLGSRSGSVSTDMNGGLSGICYKNGLNGVPLSFGGNGNVPQFPKRPRCSMSRRRFEGDKNGTVFGSSSMIFQFGSLNAERRKAECSGSSGAEAGLNSRGVELTPDSVKVGGSTVKGKRTVGDEVSARDSDEGCHVVASNGDVSSRKRRSNFRRKKDLASVGESSVIKVDPTVDNSGNTSDGLREKEGFHVVPNHRDLSTRKRRSNFRKRKDFASVGETSVINVEHTVDNSGNTSDGLRDKEGCHDAANNGDVSSGKRRSNFRKRKDLALVGGNSVNKIEASPDNSDNLVEGLQNKDEDEENLEQNAARMLSSRFDPSCTCISSKSNSSRPFQNRVSFSGSSSPEFVCNESDSLAGVEIESADAADRILRPRKKRSQKKKPRKRRHFYEILTSNFDAHWFLNRKIKVFWPLDEIWYYGLVKDYDPETKLHHVKYDDRDEEWIDLQREKFKLLLLPSEVPGRRQRKRASTSDKHVNICKPHSNGDNDSSSGTFSDSEPIISWLIRISRRFKSSSFNRSKKQKTLQAPDETNSDVGFSAEDESKSDSASAFSIGGDVDPADENQSRPDFVFALPDRSTDGERIENSLMGSPSTSTVTNCIVYVRKRLRSKIEVSDHPKSCSSQLGTFISLAPDEGLLNPIESNNIFWSTDGQGLIKLAISETDFGTLSFRICSTVLPLFKHPFKTKPSWLSNALLLPRYSTVISAWPEVVLEILFVDNTVGLRFLLFEGCLKGVILLFSLILMVFNQPHGDWSFCEMQQLPITSIRFKLSAKHDCWKKQVFTFFNFATLKRSKWLYLDSKLHRRCLYSRKLPLSDCTYDNLKSLECGSHQLHMPCFEGPSRFQNKRSLQSILSVGVPREHDRTLSLSEDSGVGNQPFSADFNDFNRENIWPVVPGISSNETSKEKISEIAHYGARNSRPGLPTGTDDRVQVTPQNISVESSCLKENISEVNIPNLTGFSSSLFHDSIAQSSIYGDLSPIWCDGRSTSIRGGFGTGPKKPRTQVQYSLPLGSYHLNSNHKIHNPTAPSYKRIRRSNKRRICEDFKDSHKNIESLACDANVLVSLRDKGWRECGARVVLEPIDHNEWVLAVKVSGITKYSHKVGQILQPGSTNRYTHAMMWKGGKDWILEFPDRSQWILFKEIYEECHNRNIRAASMKNIPIPGVRLVEESDDDHANETLLSIQHSPRYLHQLENDVEMALNPSRVFYDMDSDDEQWISVTRSSLRTDENNSKEISDELFEKTMDMLEKFAYTHQRDELTDDELEELVPGFHSIEILKLVYQHWQHKRRRKGLPLIRHFQVPLWEQYEQQVKVWEEAVSRSNNGSVGGGALSTEKPPVFAFCLKPRGLEVISRGSKQRSHRTLPTCAVDHDGFHTHGRRSNGFNDDKTVFSDKSNETMSLSPRDGVGNSSIRLNCDFSESNHHCPKLNRSKQTKNGPLMRNGIHKLDMDFDECPNRKMRGLGLLFNVSDYQEFRLIDAKDEAQQARKVAKMKRLRAQRLLYRADLAIHKASVALMTAETIKASYFGSSNDDHT